jgi:putative oxidoreductase
MRRDRSLLLLRIGAGVVFVVFGLGKFVNHGAELASFRTYGLPAPDALVILIAVIELVGGLLLIAGIVFRSAALVLAGDMVGAIVVSGIARGDPISLTVAPAELLAMLVLLCAGSGAHALRPSPALTRRPMPGTAAATTAPITSQAATTYGNTS